jgi:hypothetical protein
MSAFSILLKTYLKKISMRTSDSVAIFFKEKITPLHFKPHKSKTFLAEGISAFTL